MNLYHSFSHYDAEKLIQGGSPQKLGTTVINIEAEKLKGKDMK